MIFGSVQVAARSFCDGEHMKIKDYIVKGLIALAAAGIAALMLLMALHILTESFPAFAQEGLDMFRTDTQWRPVSDKPQFGLLPAMAGTLYISFAAVLLALLLGVGCAFFLNFYVPDKLAKILLAFIDLVAGIPSVIFGFIGLTVLVKWLAVHMHMAAGQCVLAACIVLGIMLLPFVVSTCCESIQNAREHYELAGYALGFSKEMLIVKVIFPAIRPGIVAAAMMAFGRGLGETMAVMMVVGNSPIYPAMMGRGQTIAALTALEMGSIEYGSTHLSVLYAANAVLLVILVLVMICGRILRRMEKDE